MNLFEDRIIETAFKSRGKVSDVFRVFDSFLNNSYCRGVKEVSLKGEDGSKVDVLMAEILDTNYFISDMSFSNGDNRIQISSLEKGHLVHMIYSSFLRDTPLLTSMFNDLGLIQHKADLVNYAEMLAEKNLFFYKNWFEEVILCAPQTSDWFYQRGMVAAILQDFIKYDPKVNLVFQKRLPIGDMDSFYVLLIETEGEKYYWIDFLTGDNVNVSRLEKLTGIKIEVLFASDSKQRYFIPQSSVKALLPQIVQFL